MWVEAEQKTKVQPEFYNLLVAQSNIMLALAIERLRETIEAQSRSGE